MRSFVALLESDGSISWARAPAVADVELLPPQPLPGGALVFTVREPDRANRTEPP